MDVSASYTFAAPPATVWTLLNDPNVVASFCQMIFDRTKPAGTTVEELERDLAERLRTQLY